MNEHVDMAPGDPLAELEANLAAQIPGLRLLDRELELDSRGGASGRVDLAGSDGEGRMVLVALIEDDADSAALAALDLAVLARLHGGLLARHLGLDPIAAAEPRMILIAEGYTDLLLARLEALDERFELLSIETLRSERGARTYLVPAYGAAGVAVSTPKPIGRTAFLEGLDEHHRGPAELLCMRLERMDSEVRATFSAVDARWSFQGQQFLGLKLESSHLSGFVLPHGESMVIDSVDGVERLVEAAFGAYVQLMAGDSLAEPAAGDVHDRVTASEATIPAGPLLTEEEIAAFQS